MDNTRLDLSRRRVPTALGIFCGLQAALCLRPVADKAGKCSSPPVLIPFMMVSACLFLRWSPPALVFGAQAIHSGMRGCRIFVLWERIGWLLLAVGNTHSFRGVGNRTSAWRFHCGTRTV